MHVLEERFLHISTLRIASNVTNMLNLKVFGVGCAAVRPV